MHQMWKLTSRKKKGFSQVLHWVNPRDSSPATGDHPDYLLTWPRACVFSNVWVAQQDSKQERRRKWHVYKNLARKRGWFSSEPGFRSPQRVQCSALSQESDAMLRVLWEVRKLWTKCSSPLLFLVLFPCSSASCLFLAPQSKKFSSWSSLRNEAVDYLIWHQKQTCPTKGTIDTLEFMEVTTSEFQSSPWRKWKGSGTRSRQPKFQHGWGRRSSWGPTPSWGATGN